MHSVEAKEVLGLAVEEYLDLDNHLQRLGLNPNDYKVNGIYDIPEDVVERLKIVYKPLEFLHKLSEAQLDYEVLYTNFRKANKISQDLIEENRQLRTMFKLLPKKQLVNLLLKATKCPH